MPQQIVVSWNSLIAGFVCREQVFESLGTFRRMQGERIGFSWVTLMAVLSKVSQVTALNSGKAAKRYMPRLRGPQKSLMSQY